MLYYTLYFLGQLYVYNLNTDFHDFYRGGSGGVDSDDSGGGSGAYSGGSVGSMGGVSGVSEVVVLGIITFAHNDLHPLKVEQWIRSCIIRIDYIVPIVDIHEIEAQVYPGTLLFTQACVFPGHLVPR